MKFETLVVHAAHAPDRTTGAVAPPIVLSTTFARDERNELYGATAYIRDGNPNEASLESALAPLEGGEAALAFASGMAAGAAIFQTLSPGSHVLLPDDVYYGYRVAGTDFLPNWGVRAESVRMDDLSRLRAAFRPETRLLWLESPSNPLLQVVDIAGAAALAREANVLTVVDNTFATPALQRPIELGADVVLHSTTKYLGGHSDVQGGALVFARRGELSEKAYHARHILGAVASPFNAWLILRGIRTLACRVEKQSATALSVARALSKNPTVAAVHYPGLESHPAHAIARRQMSAFGGMLSIQVRAGRDAAIAAVRRARLFTRATSLGGVESLIEHRASSEGAGSRAPQDLIRISIGLEHPDDLIEDLTQALES